MYQVNWKSWHLPWHQKNYDEDFKLYAHFAGVGPFQFHWWASK